MIGLSTSVMLGIWAFRRERCSSSGGFSQLRLDCPLTPEEYCYDKKVEEVLYPKYKSIARFLFPNAARVEVLEHAVSKRPEDGRLQNADRPEPGSQTSPSLAI
jgi:hypothetical protein